MGKTPHKSHVYRATVLVVFDPTQKYHGATITQAAYRAAIIEDWAAVGSGPDSTAAHVVNSVKILPNSILLVYFHSIMIIPIASITVTWKQRIYNSFLHPLFRSIQLRPPLLYESRDSYCCIMGHEDQRRIQSFSVTHIDHITASFWIPDTEPHSSSIKYSFLVGTCPS